MRVTWKLRRPQSIAGVRGLRKIAHDLAPGDRKMRPRLCQRIVGPTGLLLRRSELNSSASDRDVLRVVKEVRSQAYERRAIGSGGAGFNVGGPTRRAAVRDEPPEPPKRREGFDEDRAADRLEHDVHPAAGVGGNEPLGQAFAE
jgi:hypothetical protein